MSDKITLLKQFLHKVRAPLKKRPSSGTENIASNNILIEGTGGSGKNYLIRYIYERPIIDGAVKFWMWCPDLPSLREHISMMQPNPKHFEPHGFKVRLYIPLGHTAGIMPPKRVPDFSCPYSIDISALDEYTQKMIFGLKSYDEMTRIYSSVANRRNSSLALFKSPPATKQGSKEKGFYGEKWVSPKARTIEERAFAQRFKIFSKFGLLASPDFPRNLENQMMLNYRNQKEISILYTGFIEDSFIRNFLFINFVETLVKVTSQQKCSFRNVLLVNEAQNIFMKTHGTSQTDLVKILNDLFAKQSTKTRHINLDLVFDSKPHVLPKAVKHNFQHHIITQIGTEDFDEYFSSHPLDKEKMWKIMNGSSYTKEYGFIRLQDSHAPRFFEGTVWKAGYRLPYQHRSMYGEANIDQWVEKGRYHIEFPFLHLKAGDLIDLDEEFKALAGSWRDDEAIIRAKEKEEKEKAKQEKDFAEEKKKEREARREQKLLEKEVEKQKKKLLRESKAKIEREIKAKKMLEGKTPII